MLILLFKFLKERESFQEQEKKNTLKSSHKLYITFTKRILYANELFQIK